MIPKLTFELIATLANSHAESLEQSVLVFCPKRLKDVECELIVWPKGYGLKAVEAAFQVTDVTSEVDKYNRLTAAADRASPNGGDRIPYGQYIKHLRPSDGPCQGDAIISRTALIRALSTNHFSIS